MNIPFSVYDFFAYLSSGIILLATVDLVYGSAWLLDSNQEIALGVVGLFAAYVAGHVVAQFSSLILENWLVDQLLKRPSVRLMSNSKPGFWFLFPNYFRELPAETKERVQSKLSDRDFAASGEGLFLHVFGTLKQRADVKERIDSFRNLYGFSRNVCMAMLLSGTMVLIGPFDGRDFEARSFGVVMLLLGVVMLYRYLKFFRQYSYELFVLYAELKD